MSMLYEFWILIFSLCFSAYILILLVTLLLNCFEVHIVHKLTFLIRVSQDKQFISKQFLFF